MGIFNKKILDIFTHTCNSITMKYTLGTTSIDTQTMKPTLITDLEELVVSIKQKDITPLCIIMPMELVSYFHYTH